MHRFSNNAQSTLDSVLAVGVNTMVLVAGGGAAFNVFPVDMDDPFTTDGTIQAATLTHADLPGVYEVVYMTMFLADTFQLQRAREGTEEQEWPAGTKVSANVTAGMLETFVQRSEGGPVELVQNGGGPLVLKDSRETSEEISSSAGTGFVVNAASRMRDSWTIGGNSVLSHTRPKSMDQDAQAQGYESIGWLIPVDLGDTPRTWMANQPYKRGAVVAPPTPNGLQYWVHILSVYDETTVDSELEFRPDAYDRTPGGETGSGLSEWVGQPMPVVADVFFPYEVRLILTEVGFICHQYDATSPPTVSIGTDADPTRFADAVPLTQVVGAAMRIHRIPVTSGGDVVGDLKFQVVTSAAGGTCRGNFYWKGFLVEVTPEIS